MTFYLSSNFAKLMLGWLLVLALALTSSLVTAHGKRDPTQPPPLPEGMLEGAEPIETLIGIESGDITVIVRNGQPHLVIDGLSYTQGDTIGPVLIERITETEIWLSEGGILRKVSLFPDIKRSVVTPLTTQIRPAPTVISPHSRPPLLALMLIHNAYSNDSQRS